MSQFEKLLRRISSLPSDVRYEELRKILNHFGYYGKETKGGSSHVSFRKKGEELIVTIPRHEPINITYVKMVKEIIEKEEGGSNES